MTSKEKSAQLFLLQKQIEDTRYTMRSLMGIMQWMSVRDPARVSVETAVKTLLLSIELMTEAAEAMEKS